MSVQPQSAPVAKPLPTARPVAQAMPAQPAPQPQPAEAEDAGASADYGGRKFMFFCAAPGWLVSMVVHMIAILAMALINVDASSDKKVTEIVAGNPEALEEIEDFQVEDIIQDVQQVEKTENVTAQPVSHLVTTQVTNITENVGIADDSEMAAVQVELSEFAEKTAPRNDLLKTVGAVSGTGLQGRGAAAQGALVAQNGGTKGSQDAVGYGLQWLAAHQLPDGGWSFNHQHAISCQGKCDHPGGLHETGRMGATGLALLPFLGHGDTHKEGKYKEVVGRGLYYLMSNMKKDGAMSDGGGNMYAHGICSIALCEAYGMTHDKTLMAPAQACLNYIVYAQDPVGGGWRYGPKQAGDTSAVGWQLMALKSGHMSYLHVPPATIVGATKFLDSVQANNGANYGYTNPGAGQATTAVGLLARMYLGWKKDHPGIIGGAEYLDRVGPTNGNMYYNYYATQVMHHFEGEKWKKWNDKMREYLVTTQNKTGHQAGSWHMAGGDHGTERGGRLYCTAMSTMILEVYYRHMPIYQQKAASDEFPL